jgi:hypothetical protein
MLQPWKTSGGQSMVLGDGQPSLGFKEQSLIVVSKIRRSLRLVRCVLKNTGVPRGFDFE